jgi:hypothetical protein
LVAARLVGRADRRSRLGPALERAVPFALALACLVGLPRAYDPPKQDYEEALRRIAAERRPGEPVLAVGEMTRFVYADWLRADFTFAQTTADLDAAVPRGRSGLAIYAFPVFVASRHPDLWEVLRREGREVARVPGSVGDGDVVVLRIER